MSEVLSSERMLNPHKREGDREGEGQRTNSPAMSIIFYILALC